MTLEEEIIKLDLIASDAFEGGDINEFRQLAEWLRELKAYKKAYTEIDSKIESDYMGNNEYEMAVSDGYQSAINIIDRCIEEVNADDERGNNT